MLKRLLVAVVMLGVSGQAQASASHVGERADALLKEVREDGLFAVVRRTSDPLDLSLLDMIADVTGEHDLAREIAKSRPFRAPQPGFLLEGSGVAGGLNGPPVELQMGIPGTPPNQLSYSVFFQNLSGETLSEVVAFWRSPSAPIAGFQKEDNIPTGAGRAFNIDRCDLMVSYAIGVFANGQRMLRLPPEGQEMTPAVASKVHPHDGQPCADSWTLTARLAP